MEPRRLTPAASANLDLIRGLAAWAVMWGHLRALFFVDYGQLQHSGLPLRILYFLTGFGSEAVLVFFVLSGFLISSAIIGRRASGTWSWRDYAIDRTSRLYVVLIPGLLFGLLWDKVGGSVFAAGGIYSHPMANFANMVVQTRLLFATFLGNVLFLQTIVCSPFGSNGPLWSLASEFWFYVLFPLTLAAGIAWKRRYLGRAILLTTVAACVAAFVGWRILVGFLIWLTGTVLVLAYTKYRRPANRPLAAYVLISSLLFSACLVAARTGTFKVIGNSLAVGVAFSLFLFGVLYLRFGTDGGRYSRIAHGLAGFSYSLYVLHFPFLLFLRAWLVPAERWQADWVHLGYGACVGLTALTFAWVVSNFTEAKTQVARQWMRNVIPRLDSQVRRPTQDQAYPAHEGASLV